MAGGGWPRRAAGGRVHVWTSSGHPRMKHMTRPGKTRAAVTEEVTFQLDVRREVGVFQDHVQNESHKCHFYHTS